MGRAAEPHLLKALKHKDAVVRVSAAWDLSREPTPDAVAALISVADEDKQVRTAVVRSLVRLPLQMRATRPVLDALATALTDKVETIRHDASYGLGGMGPRARPALPLVARAMRHPQKEASRWGRITWGVLQPYAREAIPELIKEATQDAGKYRGPALDALATIGPDATTALLALLKNGAAADRAAAAAALGHLLPDDKRVMPAMIQALADESSRVRARAAFALGEFGPRARDAVGALIKLLKDKDEQTRTTAATSLKKIDPRAAREAGAR
jgi:HEAT repeat protein